MQLGSDLSKASKIISFLGGPALDELNDGDVDWTLNDLEAGKLLLEWLAAQVPELDDEGSEENLDIASGLENQEARYDRHIRAALRDISLEKDEVLMLEHSKYISNTGCKSERFIAATEYIPPSRSRKCAEYAQREVGLVQCETELLRSRISQTKEASQKMTKSIKLLQRAVYDLDSKTRNSEARLSELSIIADTTVASTSSSAQALLRELADSRRSDDPNPPGNNGRPALNENSDLDSARAFLITIKKNLSNVTSSLRNGMQDFSILRQQEPLRIPDLHMEADRLQKAFTSIQNSDMLKFNHHSKDKEVAEKELLDMCLALEHDVSLQEGGGTPGIDALRNILTEFNECTEGKDQLNGLDKLDVGGILREAWDLDQAALLKLQEDALDEALTSLASVLDPLENLHSSLSRLPRCIEDAEALIESLGEELGDIDLADLDATTGGSGVELIGEDKEMERELKRVLNDNKDLRPRDAPPLLLLTQQDILSELRSLKERLATIEPSEKALVEDVIHQYSVRPIHSSLPEIYANSPLNTSPPFAFPARVQDLEVQTRKRATELQNLANSLEDEVRKTFAKESNAKRLDAFIEKWTGT